MSPQSTIQGADNSLKSVKAYPESVAKSANYGVPLPMQSNNTWEAIPNKVNSSTVSTSNSISVAVVQKQAIDAVEELQEYLSLPEGWDGYRGKCFDPSLIKAAQRIVRFIASFFEDQGVAPTEITPGPASDGSLDVEVSFSQKRLIFTLEMGSNNIRTYIEDRLGNSEEDFQFSPSVLERKLAWLCH